MVGQDDGIIKGRDVGWQVGCIDGLWDGCNVGKVVGYDRGWIEGILLGYEVGCVDGFIDG
jgi:hypothetical protein